MRDFISNCQYSLTGKVSSLLRVTSDNVFPTPGLSKSPAGKPKEAIISLLTHAAFHVLLLPTGYIIVFTYL